jgi:hypothetical protein
MYIRRTQTRNTATGERYFTHRLVRSQRVGGKVRQVTVLNLGRHFAIAQADWPTLCARLEEILSGQECLLGHGSLLVEREAQRLAALLLAREGAATPEPAPDTIAPADVHSVVVDSLALTRPRTVGVEAVGLWAMGRFRRPTGGAGTDRASASRRVGRDPGTHGRPRLGTGHPALAVRAQRLG